MGTFLNPLRLPFLHQTEEVLALDRAGIGGGVFGEREADGFVPAAALAVEGVAGGGIGHGEEPPAFFRGKAAPVGDGDGNEGGIGILDGPSKQEHFLAEQAGDGRLALGPAAGGETEGFETLVELGFQGFLNGLPLGEREDAAEFVVRLGYSIIGFIPGDDLGNLMLF